MILISLSIILLSGCSSWKTPESSIDSRPVIFPDYAEVTIPYNIAPLNFMVEGADRIQASFSHEGAELIRVKGKDGIIQIPVKEWHGLLDLAKEGNIDVQVSVWSKEYPQGMAFQPFPIHVEDTGIDEWIAYRLIESGYKSWRQIGLYQRNLSTFEESAIVTNATANETCLNCHHFPAYSSESMMFHARGANGGTILYHDGKLTKINFNEIGPKKNTTYPAWHPEGRFIAFSSNTTRQTFYLHGHKPIEVYDYASDILLYDTQTSEVITDPRFMTEETLESFPAWSPDGKELYYVRQMHISFLMNWRRCIITCSRYSLIRRPVHSAKGSTPCTTRRYPAEALRILVFPLTDDIFFTHGQSTAHSRSGMRRRTCV